MANLMSAQGGSTLGEKNKVVLIYPKFYRVDFDAKSYPLGLLSIGTVLKQYNYDVKIIDFLVEDDPIRLLKKELDDSVLCVGISVMTPQISSALNISGLIKEIKPDTPVVWGGIHGTLFPEQTIRHPLVDYLILGEGEISFPKLLDYFSGNGELDNVDGLVYKRGDDVVNHPEGKIIDLNYLPILDYFLLNPKTLKFDSIILNTSRGCPYRCTFCVNVALHNRRWRHQEPKKVIEELKYLVNDLGYKTVKFQEDNFFVSKERVEKILDGIKENNLKFKWLTNCRVDYFRDDYINDEFLEKLKKVGCYKLMFGAESGSQRMLDYLKKGTNIGQIIKSAELCQKHDISAVYSFMCALPTETREERMKTLELIDKLIVIGDKVNIISPQPYRPYPGDELARECQELGYKFPKELEDWPVVVAKSMDSSSSNLEDFPWIEDPNEIRLQRVCTIVATSRKSLVQYIKRYPIYLAPGIAMFYLVAITRWKYKYFKFPVEYVLFMKVYWATQKLRKNRLFSNMKSKKLHRSNFLFKYLSSGLVLDVGNLGDGGKIHKKIVTNYPGVEAHGLDIEDQKNKNLNFTNQAIGSAELMPYSDNYFDLVYLGEVIEHTWTPMRMINEAKRVLKTGGLLILDTPNIYSLARIIRYCIKGKDVILGDPTHKIFFSRAMLENLVDKAGFELVETTTDRKFSVKGRDFTLPGWGVWKFMGEHVMIAARKK